MKVDTKYIAFKSSFGITPHLEFITITLSFEEIRKHRANLLKHEKPFKENIKQFVEESAYKDFLSVEEKKVLNNFIDSEYIYFNNNTYKENEVNALYSLINDYQTILNKIYSDYKIQLIDFQVDLDKAS